MLRDAGSGLEHQIKLIHAAAVAGIKRFLPSEYGYDTDLGYGAAVEPILGPKKEAREVLRQSGMLYTFVVTHMLATGQFQRLGT